MKNKIGTKAFFKALSAASVFLVAFMSLEPAITDAATTQNLNSIVTQTVTDEITITAAPSPVPLSGTITGLGGGSVTGSTVFTVKTNCQNGFNMFLKASTDPAFTSSTSNFVDYVPTVAGTPDYNFSVPATASEFGYSVKAATDADIMQPFKSNGVDTCNTGSTITPQKCWLDFTTSDYQVISRNSLTSSTGEAETVYFRADNGTTHIQPSGAYTAVITATATTK